MILVFILVLFHIIWLFYFFFSCFYLYIMTIEAIPAWMWNSSHVTTWSHVMCITYHTHAYTPFVLKLMSYCYSLHVVDQWYHHHTSSSSKIATHKKSTLTAISEFMNVENSTPLSILFTPSLKSLSPRCLIEGLSIVISDVVVVVLSSPLILINHVLIIVHLMVWILKL